MGRLSRDVSLVAAYSLGTSCDPKRRESPPSVSEEGAALLCGARRRVLRCPSPAAAGLLRQRRTPLGTLRELLGPGGLALCCWWLARGPTSLNSARFPANFLYQERDQLCPVRRRLGMGMLPDGARGRAVH